VQGIAQRQADALPHLRLAALRHLSLLNTYPHPS
jgi:hypothetical protein